MVTFGLPGNAPVCYCCGKQRRFWVLKSIEYFWLRADSSKASRDRLCSRTKLEDNNNHSSKWSGL